MTITFRDAAHLQAYCSGNTPTMTHWVSDLNWFKIGLWTAIVTLIYYVGRDGLPTLWSDIKAGYAWLRNKLSETKTTTAQSGTTSVA